MSTISKAEAIRVVLSEMGCQAAPRDVIRLLKEKNIDVTPQQVTNEKAKLARRGAASQAADIPLSILKKVAALADELGSTELVRRALDAIDELKVLR